MRMRWALTLSVTILWNVTGASASDDAETIAAIAALQECVGNINSIESTYTLELIKTTAESSRMQPLTWRSLQAGRLFLISIDSKPSGEGTSPLAGWWSFDGQRYLHTQLKPGNPDVIEAIESRADNRDSVPDMYDLDRPMHFVGQPLFRASGNLPDILRDASTRHVGTEAVNGHSCQRFENLRVATRKGKLSSMVIWLDPAHNYLPRRVASDVADTLPDEIGKEERPSWFVVEITDFQQLADELVHEKKWFPRIAEMSGPNGKARYTFHSVRLNPELRAEQFRPIAPPGTQVILRDAGQADRYQVSGGTAGVRARQQEIVSRSVDLANEAPVPVNAKPPQLSWSWYIISFGIVAAAASTVWKWTRS